MKSEIFFCFFITLKLIEFFDETLSDGNQGFFGPWEEPIDGTFIEESWEFLSSFSEFVSNRREAKHNMEVISNSFNEIFP
jgi:hypothetical protein